MVHNDPEQFLILCQNLNVVPDLWSLQEWSTWMAPAVLPNRFETAFFIVPLENKPNLVLEKQEVLNFEVGFKLIFFHSYLNF